MNINDEVTGETISDSDNITSTEMFGAVSSNISRMLASESPFSMTAVQDPKQSSSSTDSSRPSTKKKRAYKPPKKETVNYPDADLENAYNLFISCKTLPQFLMREQVIEYARNKSFQLLIQEKYDEASKVDESIMRMIELFAKDMDGYQSDEQSRTIETRILSTQQKNDLSFKAFEKRIQDLKENEIQKIEQFEAQQAEERNQFEKSCQTPEFLAKFAKPSNTLLQLRKVQKELALAHNFEDAKAAKAQADAVQREETELAQKRAIKSIQVGYAHLIEQQQAQLQCAKQNSQRKIINLESELEKRKESYNHLTRQLNSKLDDAKKKKTLPQLQVNKNSVIRSAPSVLATRKLLNYNNTPEMSQLELKLPPNFHQMISHSPAKRVRGKPK